MTQQISMHSDFRMQLTRHGILHKNTEYCITITPVCALRLSGDELVQLYVRDPYSLSVFRVSDTAPPRRTDPRFSDSDHGWGPTRLHFDGADLAPVYVYAVAIHYSACSLPTQGPHVVACMCMCMCELREGHATRNSAQTQTHH